MGMDVHQATTVVGVVNPDRKIVLEFCTSPSKPLEPLSIS